MDKIKLRRIAFMISVAILVTLAFQIYWNLENYSVLKQRIQNEIQISFDQSVDSYYANLAKGSFKDHEIIKHISTDDHSKKSIIRIDSSFVKSGQGHISVEQNVQTIKFKHFDSTGENININWKVDSLHLDNLSDSIINKSFSELTNMVIISLKNDSLDLNTLDSICQEKLREKNLDIEFYLSQSSSKDLKANVLYSKSSYIPSDMSLKMEYSGASDDILLRGLGGISMSFFVSLIIIFSLIFLYQQVKNQKELSEMKDDLISNLTHEFKTPIATVSAALDGIIDFNEKQDVEKTKRYAKMSQEELKKLTQLIDKLLDSASLDAGDLNLDKKTTDANAFMEKLIQRYEVWTEGKKLEFKTDFTGDISIDPFYFETAISNIIDNAIKYGGDKIEVKMNNEVNGCRIEISDNGGNIPKSSAKKVFDKFYRIGSAEIHDVKGHGIGLYSSKQIIESHGGQIVLDASKDKTSFIIKIS